MKKRAKMKKVLACLLVMMLVLASFAACGKKESKKEETKQTGGKVENQTGTNTEGKSDEKEEETVAYNNLYVSLQTMVRENTIKFITGSKPMEEYDAFVADLVNFGVEECIKYKQAALDRYNKR